MNDVLAIRGFSEIAADFRVNWPLYLSMPIIASIIGYTTKIVAVEMMFRPIEFVGIKPIFGWQGIIPRKAAKMASIAVDTMTQKLIDPREIIGRLDPQRIAKELEAPLLQSIDDIAREVAARYQPGLWESMPEMARKLIIRRIQGEAPQIVAALMKDVQDNIEQVFDIKDMVITNLLRDKPLLNRVFREIGHKEFRFIIRSGIYFGFLIGCVQAICWAVFHNVWIMPIFGLFTGWFTDWLALKMIFRPQHPTRYLGIIEWQGLFLKRRKEIAAHYGAMIADEFITPSHMFEALLKGPLSDKLFTMIQKHVQRVIDEQAGIAKPIVVFAVGSTKYQEMKRVVAEKIMEQLPEQMQHVYAYADDAMDVRNTAITKMQELNEEEFEELIRPAFEEDEWILIAVGAALGFLVGELQIQIFHIFEKPVPGVPS